MDATNTHTYVLGIDFGTDSARAVLADTLHGTIISEHFSEYALWKEGKYSNPQKNQFRQHPKDYIQSLEEVIRGTLAQVPTSYLRDISAISIAATGSTPIAVDRIGLPLALHPELDENPNAMFVLWKDHTAIHEASEINSLCAKWEVNYLKYCGGLYSSEWYWAKILHILRQDESVREKAHSWVELCDWLPALLAGNTSPNTLKRSRCAAAHKAMWHREWGGLPSKEFLQELDPVLASIFSGLYTETVTSDHIVGHLSPEWAEKFGLSQNVIIGAGSLDAHIGAVGAQIRPYQMVKVMGTSTCDMMVAHPEDLRPTPVQGICGQAEDSILPGMIGLEAGQSAFGDIYAWFRDLLSWPLQNMQCVSADRSEAEREEFLIRAFNALLPELSMAAARLPLCDTGPVGVDWLNGRRTPDSNQALRGGIAGLTLGSTAPMIFRSLVEATAFGARKIVQRLQEEGIRIDGIIAAGGVAQHSSLAMQTLADVLGLPIRVVRSPQICALGAAMCAAVVGGQYASLSEAQSTMGSGFERKFDPHPKRKTYYENQYENYSRLAELLESYESR